MRNRFVALIALVVMTGWVDAAEKVRIGLALPTQQEERWVRDLHAMQEEARRQGVELRVAIARNDQVQQNEQVEQLLAQDIGALIIAPHDSEVAAAAVYLASQAADLVTGSNLVIDGGYTIQ